MMLPKIISINISKRKGIPKSQVDSVNLITDWGIEGDVHAGNWHRQVSLLGIESIDKMQQLGLNVRPGAFAENITIEGLNLLDLRIGDRIIIGDAVLEITQIGKDCHSRCAIYYAAGDCVMPREGVFAKVIKGGKIKVNDVVSVEKCTSVNV